ncbi:unnamed protein product [Trichobilharzia szidati]|nr:unnamed protein product [Trichobilharzia szidati]
MFKVYLACQAEDDTLYTEDIDDEEIDREYLLQPREIMLKAAIWFKANAEHLEQARKRKLAKRQKEQQQQQEDIKGPKKRKTASRRNNYSSSTRSNRNAISKEEDSKPISRKINYEALEAVVGLSAAPASSSQLDQHIVPATDVDNSEPRPGPLLASTLCDNENSKELFKSPKQILEANNQKSRSKASVCNGEQLNKAYGGQDDNNIAVDNDNAEEEEEEEEAVEDDEENNVGNNDPYNQYLPNYSHGIDDDDDEDWSTGAELW